MKHSCLYSRTLGKVAFSLFCLAVLSVALTAQTTEVQIMVVGPWDYVQDPSDQNRVILVAPAASHHRDPEVFSGRDSDLLWRSHFPESVPTGVYTVDICDATHGSCYVPPSQQKCTDCSPYRLQETTNQKIPVADIKAFLSTPNDRYAISLPKPNEYTTFCRDTDVQHPDKCPGLSQSIISTQPINDPKPNPETRARDYTTWMVFRYKVSGNPLAWLSGNSDQGTSYDIPKPFLSTSGIPALSIVQAPIDDRNTLDCDQYSSESFSHSIMQWKLNLYARLPNLQLPDGLHQDRDIFDYTCPQRLTPAYLKARSRYHKSLEDLVQVSDYLEHPRPGEAKKARDNSRMVENTMIALLNQPRDKDQLDKLKAQFKALDEILEQPDHSNPDSGRHLILDLELQVHQEMAGATDCRKAQMSINGVIP